jgi:hypothetical protein
VSLKNIQKILLKLLGERLSSYGFDKKSKQQSFFKKFDNGVSVFHLSFIEHEVDFDITADIAIRFDELESIVNAQNKLLTTKEKEATCSLGVEFGNLISGEQMRWSVSSNTDLNEIVDSIFNIYEKYGEKYFEEYCSMERALELLSKDTPDVWIHSSFHAARAKSALGLAFILNKAHITTLYKKKKSFLEEQKDFGLISFNSFYNSLNE